MRHSGATALFHTKNGKFYLYFLTNIPYNKNVKNQPNIMEKLTLEGTSFAGKTTLSKELEKHNPNRYKMIEEYVAYAKGAENFPSYPPKNKEEALRNFEFFLNLERQRHVDIKKHEDKPYVMVMDRSIISLLGFEYAQKYLAGLDVFCEVKDMLEKEPDLAPDFIIYLHANDLNIKKRLQESQRKVGDLFVDPNFNQQIRNFFDWLAEQGKYPIVTIDTNKDFNQVKQELIQVADSLKIKG